MDSPKYNCGCKSGKSCFRSYDQAQAEIKRFRAKRAAIKITGMYLSVYRCKFCGHYHCGNSEKTLKKRHGQTREED